MNNLLKSEIIKRFGTQSDFAQVLGIHDARVSRVVRGREYLSEKEQARWASALKIPTDNIKQFIPIQN